jgi:hypothetical protein
MVNVPVFDTCQVHHSLGGLELRLVRVFVRIIHHFFDARLNDYFGTLITGKQCNIDGTIFYIG